MQRWRWMVNVFVGVGVLVLTACSMGPEVSPAMDGDAQRTVSVSGDGEAQATPDVAVVRLGVETEADQAATALSQNSDRMNMLVEVLKASEIDTEDIQTERVQVQPRYAQVDGEQEPRLVGYVATNVVEVRVRQLSALGDLLDAAVEAGGNRIEGLRFEFSDPAPMMARAREAAWQDAATKAEQLAALAGMDVGSVVSINESSHLPRPVVLERAESMDARAPIEPGTQSVNVSLQVSWQLTEQ